MDAQLIERLNRQRYRAVMLETFGLLLTAAETLIAYLRLGPEPNIFTIGSGYIIHGAFSVGLLILLAGGIWYGIVWLKTRRSKQLRDALYDELYMQHKYRYQRLTMWVMIIGGIVSMFLVSTPTYPHMIVTEMVIIAGLLTMKVSWLILNKN